MHKSPKHLILTSIIDTWKFDREVIFLGRWCLKDSHKSVWEEMDAEIAPPIGETTEDCDFLFLEARRIESHLFPKFTSILNQYHGTSYDERYWKILTGHWFRNVTELLTNRIYTIQRCFNQYNIATVSSYVPEANSLVQANYMDSIMQADNDFWNSQIYEKIIKLLITDTPDFDMIPYKNKAEQPQEIQATKKREIFRKESLYTTLRKVAVKFERDSDAFIINSFLPLGREFILEALLGQFPQWHLSQKYVTLIAAEAAVRKNLSQELSIIAESRVESTLATLLFDLIPIGYLEGFTELTELSRKQTWPKKPKFIFTSNNFAGDDIFTMWTANKVVEGIKYIAGQHGAGYGTHKYESPTVEEETSDKFITWGWSLNQLKYLPGFIFKNATIENYTSKSNGGLLLIQQPYTIRIRLWEQGTRFSQYMDEQYIFCLKLRKDILNELTVRLHPSHEKMLGEMESNWKNFDKGIKIDSGRVPIKELWRDNRIIVHSYDSTGMLETLEANIPTIAFWKNGLDHLLAEAIPFYTILVDVGIVHLTPESAALKISDVWDDVEMWWQSSKVQKARREFCSQYARTSKQPARDLKRILLEKK